MANEPMQSDKNGITKTPRTDACIASIEAELGDGPPNISEAAVDVVVRLRLVGFARELERELAEVRKHYGEMADLAKSIASDPSSAELHGLTPMERFMDWAGPKGFTLDHLFMSSEGVPENPFEDRDTKLAFDIWLAALASNTPSAIVTISPGSDPNLTPENQRRIESTFTELRDEFDRVFNCGGCGAHDFGLNRPVCPHCGYDERVTTARRAKDSQ